MRWLGLCALLAATVARGQPDVEMVGNGGFEEGALPALAGWETFHEAPPVALDDIVCHTGRRSARVSGHGGLRTRLIPYPGGRVAVSGWVRTQDVVTGPAAPWHQAAFQVISYNADRASVGHHDIVLLDGTRDWTRFETTAMFSREVAFLSVDCHLWGDATGTAWYDDISLRFLDDPRALRRRPLDPARATVTVDFTRDLGELRHLWIGSDVGYSDRVLSDTQINAMREARKFGLRYVRLHDCIHDPHVYAEDADGKPVYDWTGLDARIRAVVDNGMWPVVVLETMPPEIATGDDGLSWTNPYPPRGPEGYAKWQEIVRRLVAHCAETWGPDIRNWYFEVWNEPDSSGYFRGTLEEYLRVYDHAVAGATAADPGLRIGGPGGAGTGWLRPFLAHCRSGRNDATGGIGCRADFLSWHIYTVGVGVPAFDNLTLSLAAAREALDSVPGYRDLPTLITEWGCASSPNAVHDRPYDAAFRVMAVRDFLDAGITLALPFCLGEGPPHAHDGFMGGLALYTKTTIPKPSARAFELLHRMTGRRVGCETSNDPVDGLASLAGDGRSACVLLWNLREGPDHPAYRTEVTVRVAGLPPGRWTCRATAIAPGECDPFLAWEAMGSPETLTDAQRAALLKASALPPRRRVAVMGDRLTLTLAVPGYSVVLLELTRRD